jgi:hypothetical protein
MLLDMFSPSLLLPERPVISDMPPSTHMQTGHWLQRVSMVMDQFMRLLHECGLPKTDVDVLNCQGPVMNEVLVKAKPHMTLFTGSSRIAEKLALDLSGKVCIDCGLSSGRRAIGPRLPYQPIESWKKPGGRGAFVLYDVGVDIRFDCLYQPIGRGRS